MIKTVDDFLMNLAKKMITVAAFFGISRWQLTVSWIWLSILSYCYGTIVKSEDSIVIILTIFILLAIGFTLGARMMYREDDILSPYLEQLKHTRVIYVAPPPLLIFCLIVQHWSSGKQDWTILYYILQPTFHLYLLFQQSPQNPLRLRNLVKNALGKIKQALQPAPQPQHQPSPTA